jgi:CheY-like chemotaxis protein
LRNPLAPALTGLALLREAPDDQAGRTHATAMIERQVRHLKRLVDDLLDEARITRGQMALRLERLDLGRLARTAAGDRRRLLEQAGLTLTVQVPETPVWARGDEVRLTQVMSNLLDNAAKFTDRGGAVTVRLAVAAGQAVLTVTDTGIGIAPAVLPRLFAALTQADRSLDRARGGLGLGLSVVRGLVELHGGRVEAASRGEGQGSEFTVRLPVEDEPAALAAPPAKLQPASRRLRVVVVEDNKDAANILRLFLEALGCEARVAYTGPEGVRTAVAWKPDAVLSDVGLPGLNGLELAAELRKRPETASALLVGISGYGSDEDVQRAHEAGFNHYLVKPADPAAILQILKHVGEGQADP